MTSKALKTFEDYRYAMVCLEVEKPDGTISIGSGFHVGDGAFLTARHVVEHNRILAVYAEIDNREERREIVRGPFFARDARDDVACFQLAANHAIGMPTIQLGGHLDDWLGPHSFILFETLVMGYPPIPFAKEPYLVASRGEVSAQIDTRYCSGYQFIISVTARGGFSGGPVLVTDDDEPYLLGLVSVSLTNGPELESLGYLASTGIEPLYDVLVKNGMLADVQREIWGSVNTIWDDDHSISPTVKPKVYEDFAVLWAESEPSGHDDQEYHRYWRRVLSCK